MYCSDLFVKASITITNKRFITIIMLYLLVSFNFNTGGRADHYRGRVLLLAIVLAENQMKLKPKDNDIA